MTGGVVIRPYALPADLDGLVGVFMDSVTYHADLDPDLRRPPVTIEQARRRFMELEPEARTLRLVAELDGVVAGLVEARLRHDDITGFTGVYVDELAVAAGLRGRGIGTRLMETVEAWARDRGAESIALDAMVGNAGALRLYETHLGYTPTAVILRKNLDTARNQP